MKQYITYITTLLLLTACSSAEEFFQNGDSGKTPMSLSFGMTGESDVASRAVVNSFTGTEHIGVSVRSSATTKTYDGIVYENIIFQPDGTHYNTTPMLSANTGYVYAYYPHADNTDVSAVSMSAANAQTDYMYGSATSTATGAYSAVTCNDHDASKTIYMHHAKALLEINVIRGTYTGTATVTAITASGDNLTNTGTLNATTGSVTPGDKADITVSLSRTLPTSGAALDESGVTNDSKITEDILVVSKTTGTQSVTFTITVDGKDYAIEITGLTIKSQYKTTINLTLNDTELTLNGFSISPWGSATASTGTIAPKAEPEYVEIGGLKWATMNVGATTVADSPETSFGDYYAWATTESLISSIDWTKLTAWGTSITPTFKSGREAGYTSDNYLSSSYSPTTNNDGTSCLDDAHDIGKLLYGGNWHVPSLTEFSSLYSCCGGSESGATVISEAGETVTGGIYWVNPEKGSSKTIDGVAYKVPGVLFVATDEPTKRVFFPATGYLNESLPTNILNPGTSMVYWSSSLCNSTYPYCLLSMYYSGYYIVTLSYGFTKCQGSSIRLVSN